MNGGGGLGRSASALAIAGLVVAAFLLRWFGLGFLLPQSIPVDAFVLFSQVEIARGHAEAPSGVRARLYPQLIPRLVALLPSECADPVNAADSAQDDSAGRSPRTLAEHLARARAPYLQVNLVIAVLSLFAVPATCLLARRFLERPWALLASAWMATSVLHLWFSQQGRPHGAAVSFNLIALLGALRLRRKPVASSYLFVGIALALAFGVLQSGIAAILPCVVAFFLRDRRGPRVSPAFALVPVLALAAAWVAFYPAPPPSPTDAGAVHAFEIEGSTIRWSGHEIYLNGFNGRGLANIVGALVSYDPFLTALAALGGVLGLLALVRRTPGEKWRKSDTNLRDDRFVVLAYAVPYACVVALYGNSFQRFAIPLLPFLACLAAYAARSVGGPLLRDGGWRRIVATAGILGTLGAQAFAASKVSWIRSRPDTATEAAAWIRTHLQVGTDRIVQGPGFDLPLFATPEDLATNDRITASPTQRWLRYQIESVPATAFPSERYDLQVLPTLLGTDKRKLLGDPDGYVRSLQADWVVIEVHRAFDWRGFYLLHEALERNATLAARFSPDGGDRGGRENRWHDVPIAYQLYDPLPFPIFWFRRILSARCTGSAIEIWKMRE